MNDLQERVRDMLTAEDHPGDVAMLSLIADLWREISKLKGDESEESEWLKGW